MSEEEIKLILEGEAKEDKYFRIAAMRKREKLEDSGYGDELQELQQFLWPVDRLCQNSQQGKKFRVDMLFEKTDQETKQIFCVWSQGEVIDVKRVSVGKKNEIVVMVKWDEQFVESEPVTREILTKSKWNMDKPGCRAWREDLYHKLLKIK